MSFKSGCHTDSVGTEGLRERKKARTRAELQSHALRLFRDRGYADTTVDDIAAAAEVSRSTFFRYFPTKEDVVLFDDVDPLMAEAFEAQPPGTALLTALRAAMRTAFANLPPEKRALEETRMELARQVPEIQAALRSRGAFGIEQIADGIASAVGRDASDPDVLIFAGVVLGARLAAHSMADSTPGLAYTDALDAVLGRLEQGVPLAAEPITIPASGTFVR